MEKPPLSPPVSTIDTPPPAVPDPANELEKLALSLAGQMRQRWSNGERPLAEELLALHPILWQHPEQAFDLIYEEVCLRQKYGLEENIEKLSERFPQWRPQLGVLLDCHRLLEPDPDAGEPKLPREGEALGDFRLLLELGRGAGGCVFLATQTSLGDRPVVLKITPCSGSEHLSLARLQHTNIVPLYAVSDDPGRRLRILCMPYFGSANLALLLDQLGRKSPAQRSGQQLVAALDRIEENAPIRLPTDGPTRQLLSRLSYVRAVCWIGACLAEGLQYAHERGLVHFDLKPSNVLLAADGQPMLLDFHLARAPVYPAGPMPDHLGGTPLYMPPEQKEALKALSEGRTIPAAVDGRADIYALGMLLYEALAGEVPIRTKRPMPEPSTKRQRGDLPPTNPQRPRGELPLWQRNAQVSVSLSDLIARCVDPDPARRPASAADVAGDLRRHLSDQPLRCVANRSWLERWQKWRRRRPAALRLNLMLAAVGAAVLALILGFGLHLRHQLDEAGRDLLEGQKNGGSSSTSRRRWIPWGTVCGMWRAYPSAAT